MRKNCITAIILFVVTMLTIQRASASQPRPNILWVVSEDNSPKYVGAYGDPLANTPNIDQLAKKGITFDAAYTAPICAPSRNGIITGRYASSMGTQHMRSEQPLPEGVQFFPEFLREAGYYCTNNSKTDYNTSSPWEQAWDESSNKAHWRNRNPEQPFFSVFNFHHSHESRLLQRVPLSTDPSKVAVPQSMPDTPAIRAEIARYYDCVNRADTAIGEILQQLEADGLAEDTIVLYYSDHGGVVAGTKRFLNEAGTRAAMVAYFPEKYAHLSPQAPGTRFAEVVNFIDLAPTTLSLASIPLPDQFQGRAFAGPSQSPAPEFTFNFADRMDERYNLTRAVTDGRYRYIRNYYPERPWGQFSDFLWRLTSVREWELYHEGKLTDPTQSQFFEPQPAEALYDSLVDPDNVYNLAEDPAQQSRVARMREALRKHILEIRDTGFLPEPMMTQMANGASPTVVTSKSKMYPLNDVVNLVETAQVGDHSLALKLIQKAATHKSPVLRYWAASLSSNKYTLNPLLSDENPVVRIAAAESTLRLRKDEIALKELESEIIQTEQPQLRHFALDAFERLTSDASDALVKVLGQLAASDAWGGIDYFLSRLSRRIIATNGEPPFIINLRLAEQAFESPYPQSKVVSGIELDWSTHQRFAPGSDNFQLTWADDDNLYGSWGDGGGFGGTNKRGRVSLGFARIEGPASNYKGYNVWGGHKPENPATFTGKSWATLAIGSKLHMWTVPDVPTGKKSRNHYEYIELATSTNYGATWEKADWKFVTADELTIPTFLNFGKANSGIPKRMDGYVYTYFVRPERPDLEEGGPDGRALIVHKPGIIYLARALEKSFPPQKEDFEFFAGLDASERAIWGSLKDKLPVFKDSNGAGWCMSASYNPSLDRIILATQHQNNAKSLLGIFDAPNPWGPWTTVEYYTKTNPFGAERLGSELAWKQNVFFLAFPTKWLADERFTLNFTGGGRGADNDSFNTVQGNFKINE